MKRHVEPIHESLDWKGRGDANGKRHWKGVNGGRGCIDRPRCIFRLLIIRNFSTGCDSEKSSGKSQRNKRLSFINVPSECIIQARWIYNHSHFEWERSGKSVFNGEWRVSVSSLWSRSSGWEFVRAFGIQAAKRRGDRVGVNNLSGFVSVDRVRPGGMTGKGRMAIQYQVSDSVHRFIYPPDTSSSRVEGMEGPSNSKIPAFNTIQSSWTSPREGVRESNVCPCLNRIAARNAKDSFFFLSFFFLWLLRESFGSFQFLFDLISIPTIRPQLAFGERGARFFEIKRETILTLFSEICIRPYEDGHFYSLAVRRYILYPS